MKLQVESKQCPSFEFHKQVKKQIQYARGRVKQALQHSHQDAVTKEDRKDIIDKWLSPFLTTLPKWTNSENICQECQKTLICYENFQGFQRCLTFNETSILHHRALDFHLHSLNEFLERFYSEVKCYKITLRR